MDRSNSTVLELTVRNHPGVMSHVAGLFSRRAFNLDAIVCAPDRENGSRSRIYLLVRRDGRLEQTVKQVRKLYDVIALAQRDDVDPSLFARLHTLFAGPSDSSDTP